MAMNAHFQMETINAQELTWRGWPASLITKEMQCKPQTIHPLALFQWLLQNPKRKVQVRLWKKAKPAENSKVSLRKLTEMPEVHPLLQTREEWARHHKDIWILLFRVRHWSQDLERAWVLVNGQTDKRTTVCMHASHYTCVCFYCHVCLCTHIHVCAHIFFCLRKGDPNYLPQDKWV